MACLPDGFAPAFNSDPWGCEPCVTSDPRFEVAASDEAWRRGEGSIELDAARVEDARQRAEGLIQDARHHEREARVARSAAKALAHTWGFEMPAKSLDTGAPKP